MIADLCQICELRTDPEKDCWGQTLPWCQCPEPSVAPVTFDPVRQRLVPAKITPPSTGPLYGCDPEPPAQRALRENNLMPGRQMGMIA